MGQGSGGNTLGEHFGKGIPIGFGNTIRDNLHDMMQIVPLNKTGYFGERSSRKIDVNCVEKIIVENQIATLQNVKGKKLTKLEYADVLTDDTSWNTIRLHFDNKSIDIHCILENISIDDDDYSEEFGIISVTPANLGEMLKVPEISSNTSSIPINKKIDKITVLNENIKTFEAGIEIANVRFTKAIIFSFKDTMLGIDRRIFYDEILTFKFGNSLEEVFHDDSDSWTNDGEENSDITFDYSITTLDI